VKADGYAMHVL